MARRGPSADLWGWVTGSPGVGLFRVGANPEHHATNRPTPRRGPPGVRGGRAPFSSARRTGPRAGQRPERWPAGTGPRRPEVAEAIRDQPACGAPVFPRTRTPDRPPTMGPGGGNAVERDG